MADVLRRAVDGPMTENAEQSTASPWYTLIVLIVAYVFAFLDLQILSLLVGPLERDLHITDTQVSVLQGFVFALFLALAGLPLGRLVDTKRRLTVASMGLACWSVTTAACGLASSYGALVLLRIGVGVGEASLTPAAHSVVADSFPPKRLGLALGIYGLGTFVGAGLAFVIGGAIIGQLPAQADVVLPLVGAVRPWQLVFLIIGLAGLPVAPWLGSLREPRRHNGGSAMNPDIPEVIGFFRRHLAAISLLDLAAAFVAMSAYAATAWIPTFFIRHFAWSAAQAGLSYGLVVMLCGVAGVIAGGALSDSAVARGWPDGRIVVIGVAALAAAPFAAAAGRASNPVAALALLVPATFFSTMAIGIVPAAQQAMMPNRMRGVASALGVLVVNLIGLGLGPTIVALLTDRLFADQAAVGLSLAMSLPLMLTLGAVLALASRVPYRRALAALPHFNNLP